MAISQYAPLQVAYTIVRIGKRLEDVSFDELNDTWRHYYASDRRYRLFFSAVVDGNAIFRIGKLRMLVEQRIDGCVYARWINDDIFKKKACWRVVPTGEKESPHVSEWQEVVRI